jgi:hypothetical protein
LFDLGGPNDVPVVGDWNGDGVDEPGIYHAGPVANVAAAPGGPAGAGAAAAGSAPAAE